MIAANYKKTDNPIRQAREKAGFSLAEAAVLLGMTKQQLSEMENYEEIRGNIRTLWKIADLYVISLDELVGREIPVVE